MNQSTRFLINPLRFIVVVGKAVSPFVIPLMLVLESDLVGFLARRVVVLTSARNGKQESLLVA